MIIIKDNVFEEGFGESYFKEWKKKFPVEPDGHLGYLQFYKSGEDNPFYNYLTTVLSEVGQYIDLTNIKGTEMWVQEYGTGNPDHDHFLASHIDCDEAALEAHDFIFKPMCNIIYYPLSVEGSAGKLYLPSEGLVIPPRKNRLIILSNDTLHEVGHGKGMRTSILMNPFAYIPKTHIMDT